MSESEEVADGIVVDYDTEGRVVGIEILDASKRAGNPETLKSYSFELPALAPLAGRSERMQRSGMRSG